MHRWDGGVLLRPVCHSSSPSLCLTRLMQLRRRRMSRGPCPPMDAVRGSPSTNPQMMPLSAALTTSWKHTCGGVTWGGLQDDFSFLACL